MNQPDPDTFFSFGGGVQSTAIAMILCKEPHRFTDLGLFLPKTIVFADTGSEPLKLYPHIERVFDLLEGAGYEPVTVLQIDKEGKPVILHESERGLASVPWFTENADGERGILRRQCTSEFKITPIQKEMRKRLGYKKGQRIPTGKAKLWLGISADEQQRARINPDKWIENIYPLLAIGWNRVDCAVYAKHHLGYDVPKSACFFCPFTNPKEWERRKELEPEEFQRAVEVEKNLKDVQTFGKRIGNCNNPIYIHPSCKPLDDAVLDQLPLPVGYGFRAECSGSCGV
jgi:hypothetical protein